jgi:urocanate hydratase
MAGRFITSRCSRIVGRQHPSFRAIRPGSVASPNRETGVMRHADAGYPEAIDCAREKGLTLPSL